MAASKYYLVVQDECSITRRVVVMDDRLNLIRHLSVLTLPIPW